MPEIENSPDSIRHCFELASLSDDSFQLLAEIQAIHSLLSPSTI